MKGNPKSGNTEESAENNTDTIRKSLKEWLNGEGYPLEFRTAATLQTHDFEVLQGVHALDSDTGKMREIDLLATRAFKINGGPLLQSLFVIECKWADDKPWIALSSQGFRHSDEMNAHATLASSCTVAEAAMWASLENPAVAQNAFVVGDIRKPFALKRSFVKKGERDHCYAATQSVVKHAQRLIDVIREGKYEIPSINQIMMQMYIIRPVIVLKSSLWEAYMGEGSDISLDERSWLRLAWHGMSGAIPYAIVDVVTEHGLDDYLGSMTRALQSLLEALAEAHGMIQAARLWNKIEPLKRLMEKRPAGWRPALLASLLSLEDHQSSK